MAQELKVKCEGCGTIWKVRDLNNHPDSQIWVNSELVECPYCMDESRQFEIALMLALEEPYEAVI